VASDHLPQRGLAVADVGRRRLDREPIRRQRRRCIAVDLLLRVAFSFERGDSCRKLAHKSERLVRDLPGGRHFAEAGGSHLSISQSDQTGAFLALGQVAIKNMMH
jgi:hypothetical protein